MKIKPGMPAPNFTLFDSSKTEVTLSDQKGSPVLLLFFPFAFSSVCTAEMCAIRDNMNKYESVQARIFGISVDSLYTLARFKKDENLSFSFLSDFNKEVSKTYDVYYETFSYGMKGVSKRAAFIIDKEGIVQYAEVMESPAEQPDFKKIQEILQQLQVSV